MNELIKLSEYSFVEVVNILFLTVTLIVIAVRTAEKFLRWCYSKFMFFYNKKRGKEEEEETIANSIKKINKLSAEINDIEEKRKENIQMFLEHEEAIAEKMKEYSKGAKAIQDQQKENVRLFTEHEIGVLKQLEKITAHIDEISATVKKIDSQHEVLAEKFETYKREYDFTDKENREVDCAVLRDRIFGGMRYFRQFKDENGVVHISASDHENMDKLFKSYFKRGGNGTVKTMYENEFKKFVIDN